MDKDIKPEKFERLPPDPLMEELMKQNAELIEIIKKNQQAILAMASAPRYISTAEDR